MVNSVGRERLILVPVANDATLGDKCYTDIGSNTALRIDAAREYAEKIHGKLITWVFGAGTGAGYESGKTLAYFAKKYLRASRPLDTIFANEDDPKAYGTLEEITWVIMTARNYYPHDILTFIFFIQGRPLWRLRFILWLFFPKVKAKFEETGQMFEIPWSHEMKGYVRLLLIKCRIVKPRW